MMSNTGEAYKSGVDKVGRKRVCPVEGDVLIAEVFQVIQAGDIVSGSHASRLILVEEVTSKDLVAFAEVPVDATHGLVFVKVVFVVRHGGIKVYPPDALFGSGIRALMKLKAVGSIRLAGMTPPGKG